MILSDRAEEILETMWVHTEEDKKQIVDLGVVSKGDAAIEELEKSGHVKLIDNKITLTEAGRREGRQVVRRHRLAERLFTDILDIKRKLVHPVSCQFEHLLHKGIDENICILLGHPKTCPHGKPIPEGECCRKSKVSMGKAVSPLSGLKPKQKGRVAYIHTKDDKKLQKLMAMGVLPGMAISLIQSFPSYVFQIGQSQFAIDTELAECIFVRFA